MAESEDVARALADLRERLARLEARMAAPAASSEAGPLMEEKEALLQEMERLAAQRQAGEVVPDLYESSLRALVDRLALLDEELAAAAVAPPGADRMDAVEADLADLARGLAQVENRFRDLREDLDRATGSAQVEGVRRGVEALAGELRDNVRRLLTVDARTVEQLKEIQGILRGGRMESLEKEIDRVRSLYQDFVSQDRIAQFTERVREAIEREELEPLRKSVDRVEVAFERQSEEVREGVARLQEDARAKFDDIRAQVQELREEALRLQRERLDLLQARVADLAGGLAKQAAEVPPLREQLGGLQKRVEGLSGDLQALSNRVRYRPARELEKERARVEAELDLLRGAKERGEMDREEFEKRAAPHRGNLAEIRERLRTQKQIEALARLLPVQRRESKRILDELRQVPRPEEIRKLLGEMRRSMASEELEALRGELALARATLRNRVEELPVELEKRLREAPERLARAAMGEMRAEAGRLTVSLGQTLRKELETRLPVEAERLARETLRPEMHDLRAETARALAGVSEEVARLRVAVDGAAAQGPALRRDAERMAERVDSLARRVEKPGLDGLLALKERALQWVEKLQADGARGLLPPKRFEEEMKRAVAEAADIDGRIDEALKMERVLARLQEQGALVESVAKSVEEVRALVAAGEARAPEREEGLLQRVREMLADQETLLALAAETRLRALQAETDRQRAALASVDGRVAEMAASRPEIHDVDGALAQQEERFRRALERLSSRQEGLRDAVAAADLGRSRSEPAVEARLRALEGDRKRLQEVRDEVERLQLLVAAPPGAPRKRGLAELEAERQRLLEFIRGLSRPS